MTSLRRCCHRQWRHDVVFWTTKTALKSNYIFLKKAWEKNNHFTPEGTRESHPRVHDLRHPRLGKPCCGLQIMDTPMGFLCPFRSIVIDSISEFDRKSRKNSIWGGRKGVLSRSFQPSRPLDAIHGCFLWPTPPFTGENDQKPCIISKQSVKVLLVNPDHEV